VIFVTHNMGIVAQIADRVLVMYAGRVVEQATTRELFRNPRHPYTRALMRCIPRLDRDATDGPHPRLESIAGSVPSPASMPAGCKFADRCELAVADCRAAEPPLFAVGSDEHQSRCLRWSEL
jgi:peptide/nickel transport system ATP-binding protein